MAVTRETLELLLTARDEATRDLDRMGTSLEGLKDLTADLAAGIGLASMGAAALSMGKLAASADRVGTAFQGLAGSGADAMLGRLSSAAQGTISQMDLMLSANRAMMLGVTKDAEEMARLLEIAGVRGQAMGLSTQQAFDDLMTGIGRLSPMILDNLGIVTGGAAVYDAYAASIGRTAESLSDLEKRQALVQLVMQQGEGMTFTADDAAGWEQLSAALADMKVEMGELVNETLKLPEAVRAVAGAVSGLNDALGAGATRQQAATNYADAYRQALEQLRAEGRLSETQFKAQTAATWALEQAAKGGIISLNGMHEQMNNLNPVAALLALSIRNQGNAAAVAAGQNSILAGSLGEVEDAARRAARELAALSAGSWQDWMGGYASEIDAGLMEGSVSLKARLDAQGEAQRLAVENWSAARDAEGALERTFGAKPKGGGGGGVSDAEREAREWATRVKSAVDSVFQATQVTDRDWWETGLGMYEDKPDEYLRRLRSAATQADSEWKHLLGGREGDEAKLFMAQQEELWRTGQWSQMGEGFDMAASREAMVNATLQRLSAEASREAMIADIMSDPRLGGFSVAQRERALGTGGEAGGSGYAEAWVAGAVSVDAGKEFTEAFGTQMQGQQQRWRIFGSLSAGWIIDGMGDAAEGARNQLVDILFPGIYDRLERSGVVKTP